MKLYVIIGIAAVFSAACSQGLDSPAYEDRSHFSEVFGHEKSYRIYLPDDYENTSLRYPVIYFFHGWGGRHFSDENANLDYEHIDQLVEEAQVILVMWDGNIEESERRPYNIGNHEDVKYDVQMKDYFPELVSHIDSACRTLRGRSNRGIIGYSMGGITSWYLAGKYPHMVGAAVNMTGSPEFFMGYPDCHTLYSLRYTLGNLHGIHLRFHNSTVGELAFLNREVHKGALREAGLNYLYREYEGGHKVDLPGEIGVFRDAFDFVVRSFRNPLPQPALWHHVDLYPDFEVWDYRVTSNLDVPGFIEMKNVTKQGMGIGTKKWLPGGPPVPGVKIQVKTAPLYEPESAYTLFDYNTDTGEQSAKALKSDPEGRIAFSVNHETHQIGIYRGESPAAPFLVSFRVNDIHKTLHEGKPGKLHLKILNRGGSMAQNLRIELSTGQEGVSIINPVVNVEGLQPGEALWTGEPFEIEASVKAPEDASPWRIRFNLSFKDDQNNRWSDDFDLPLFFNVPEFTEIGIDDGRAVSESGPVLGSGNGNGIPEAGEILMIYTGNHRTRLYTEDRYVVSAGEKLFDEVLPAIWPDGYTLSSQIKISDDCPDGHTIRFQASYETKEHMPIKRRVHWGQILLKVSNP